jgi:DNA polymerase III subunit epsilon
MMLTNRFWNFGFLYIILTLAVIGLLFFFIWQTLTPQETEALILITAKNGLYFIGIFLLGIFLLFIGLQLIYKSYIKPVKTICAESEIIYSTNPSHRIRAEGKPELQNIEIQKLVKLINGSADMFENLNKNITEQILIARKETEKEKNLLAAIMSEFPHGVIVCNKNGRILLFNSIAKSIFTSKSGADKAELFLSLGRSVFHLLDKALILRAVQEIEERLDDPDYSAVSCFITRIREECLIYGEAIPVLNADNLITGFILVFHDVTQEINLYEQAYEQLIAMNRYVPEKIEKVRTSLNVSDISVENELISTMETWKAHYNEMSRILLAAISTRISLTWDMVPDFLQGLRHRQEEKQDIGKQENRENGLKQSYTPNFQRPVKTGTHIRLKANSSAVIMGQRHEFYDLDLFSVEENDNLMDTYLTQLIYTVFDTETTGLNPDGGDEIISIAAVRIVNNKIIYHGKFDELINPKRDIPPESYRIHGISYDMVSDKDDIQKVLPTFKDFVGKTVLLGHNVAFDMKMFKVKEKITGITLNNPVLDTLLLSAALHPVHTHHDMENIAQRLGVDIIGRHTALGDAIITAKIFLKLLPILNTNGVLTLKDAINASQQTYYARLKY